MKRIWFPLLVISVILFAVGVALLAQSPAGPNQTVVPPLVLYDDFNGPRIDPTKWNDWMGSVSMREVVREISPSYQGQGNNGRLRLFQRAYSERFSDTGATYGGLGLQFTNPTVIREVSFDIAVTTATVSGCQGNPSAGSTAWTGFVGRFFNSGSGNGDDDVMGDIGLFRESTDLAGAPLRVQATLSSGAGYYDSRTLGYVALGQTAKLHLKWDPVNHQFVFQLNRDPVVPIGYGFSDTNPAAVPFKEFYASRGVPNCTTTPLGSAVMDTYFDNVYVNPY
jgi:hypothetical protein